MGLFTKPCGCWGTSFWEVERTVLKVRSLFRSRMEEKESPELFSPHNIPECCTSIRGQFPTYTSTDLIEIQRDKVLVSETENRVVVKDIEYLLYGCRKCEKQWKEKYRSKEKSYWKDSDEGKIEELKVQGILK